MDFRARFAPSPTGKVHIGNIRTAIFNWLATRHNKGTFLLRIEDTDLERSTKEAIDKLFECMDWLGMDHDEEIMYQTTQSPLHLKAAEKLTDAGDAYLLDPHAEKSPLVFKLNYHCDAYPFIRPCGEVEMPLAPDSAVSLNLAGIHFNILSHKGKEAEMDATLAGFKDLRILDADGKELYHLTDEEYAKLTADPLQKLTFEHCAKLKFQRREVFYNDLVKGELAKPLDSMKDFIIVRTDGSPVFHLANVYDDVTQNVTHIVRGDDHVENTYKHLFLFAALGFTPPKYAHLPMIVNAAGKPYSKRDGDAFVGDFREKGFLPEALFNYLALLGWSPGDDREKMSREELVEAFTIERALRSPAQFDIRKLTNMNALYIAAMPEEEYRKTATEFMKKFNEKAVADPRFEAVATLMHSRVKTFADVAQWNYFFVADEELEYDPKAGKKFLSDEKFRAALLKIADRFEQAGGQIPSAEIEPEFHAIENELGIPQGKLNQAVRVAVTGTTVGAGICEMLEIIPSASTAKRIRRALTLQF